MNKNLQFHSDPWILKKKKEGVLSVPYFPILLFFSKYKSWNLDKGKRNRDVKGIEVSDEYFE